MAVFAKGAKVGAPGVLAIAVGLLLLLVSAWLWFQITAAGPPYHYVMDETGQDAVETVHSTTGALPLRTGKVMAASQGEVLAHFATASSTSGPVLMRWQPTVDDPFLHLQPALSEVTALAEVLDRHVAADTPVLAWWDVSRQLRVLSDRVPLVFDAPLGGPLFVPTAWRAWQSQVEHLEASFWGAPEGVNAQTRFNRFAQALLMEEEAGMTALRDLVQGRKAVLVLHVRDIIQLGHMWPNRIGVAFRDFPPAGDVHGTVRSVRHWLSEHDYSAYALMGTQGQPVRAIALMDVESGMGLATRLLPFIGNAQYDVPGATLVYQVGGFSVYEIAPAHGDFATERE
ncbi:hydroxylamine oxidation protein HaoB [Allopusillimonas ginsengisoli]|uniref:hydroxylamine oxidation protein HaoB n=1 Tax=Allopusillimonas ginsengisoli TaxID=453575 RepID=UPI00102194DD|nr:hydroxylamine oxidation protein HaoB [Allopusillimonas ginsengisoli]TEA78988.1 hydroxylamine oxidation protein HaoB [Allopusillimonas ginsengisoli]